MNALAIPEARPTVDSKTVYIYITFNRDGWADKMAFKTEIQQAKSTSPGSGSHFSIPGGLGSVAQTYVSSAAR